MATIKHKVVWGDTLSHLAVKYKTTVSSIAKLNNIKNIHRIYVGQVLYISGKPSSSSGGGGSSSGGGGGSAPAAPPNNVHIHAFGLQADTERTFFAQWWWEREHTKGFRVIWKYETKNGLWFVGSDSEVNQWESIYNVPANATKVQVKVLPISETYSSNNNQVSYWTASWCTWRTYDLNDLPPKAPPTPTVTLQDYTLTCRVENLEVNGNEIEFEIVYNDYTTFKMGVATIITSAASYSCTLNAGLTYKARCRTKRWGTYSEWSKYTAPITTKPSAPAQILACMATSKTSVLLKWTPVETAEKYGIEYTKKKEYFDGSNAITKVDNITTTQYEITGMEAGERYFFRVKAINSKGESGFTAPATVVIGTKPSAPTTWSSTSTVIVGEELLLYWVHNSEDESKETTAELELNINGTKITKTIKNTNPDEENKTSVYSHATTGMIEGATIRWRVRTAGITMEYGDWSVERTINVYAPPTLSLELLNHKGNPFNVLESFPFYIRGKAGPATQKAISFHVSMVALNSYETVDEIGNVKMVVEGDEVYSAFFDISTELMLEIMPGSVDLQNNVEYEITCTVAMDSGLSTSVVNKFTVSWIDETFVPNAEITVDKDTLAAHIRPYCEHYPDIYYQVVYENQQWIRTSVVLPKIEGISVDDAFTQTYDDIVYAGMHMNVLTHFCIVKSDKAVPITDLTLSVYRREFNGSFTEIGKNLVNTDNTFVTDPHPSLDYARYRIVAISTATGSVSYVDLPAYYIGEKSIVIQWNERWSNYNAIEDIATEKPAWAGSMLKLPYNIDVSDSNDTDVTLVNYIGRQHPVSYYGTQVGSKATWNVDIPRQDVDTIYALRRLAIWMGDVYVREPSGSGYWANLNVSFSQTHKETVIPVTIGLKRVEGGV